MPTRRRGSKRPAIFPIAIIATGIDPSYALVVSQVILSFGIPAALIPLLIFCSKREIMGELVNGRTTTIVAAAIAAIIVVLNVVLLLLTFGIL